MEIIYEYLIHHDTIVTQLGSEKIFYPLENKIPAALCQLLQWNSAHQIYTSKQNNSLHDILHYFYLYEHKTNGVVVIKLNRDRVGKFNLPT